MSEPKANSSKLPTLAQQSVELLNSQLRDQVQDPSERRKFIGAKGDGLVSDDFTLSGSASIDGGPLNLKMDLSMTFVASGGEIIALFGRS